jgi:tetrahydromethanopterin S-methyltransferase subunit B
MNSKVFSQRFNRELSVLGFPQELAEKTKAVSKVFGVTRHLANAMIFGNMLPSDEQLDRIAEILEVCPQWLSGRTDRKKAYPGRELAEVV